MTVHKFGKKAGEKVEKAMHEMKRGALKSGGSGKKVTNPKQAIAIGLSEARKEGGKVPASPKKKSSPKKKATAKKSTTTKATPKKRAAAKSTAKKSSTTKRATPKRKTSAKKTTAKKTRAAH